MNTINLPFIAQQAQINEAENHAFRIFLKQQNSNDVDQALKPIAQKYLTEIDCTQCGNCCKNIMITLDEAEAQKIADTLQQPLSTCKQQYFETSNSSDVIMMSAIPCHFLANNKCTIYKSRPSACASFPHLDLPNFNNRLLNMIAGYGLCPQIYHSMEALKVHFKFKYTKY